MSDNVLTKVKQSEAQVYANPVLRSDASVSRQETVLSIDSQGIYVYNVRKKSPSQKLTSSCKNVKLSILFRCLLLPASYRLQSQFWSLTRGEE